MLSSTMGIDALPDLPRHAKEAEIDAYAQGLLSGEAEAGVEDHLLTCHRCQNELQLVDDLVAALRTSLGYPRPKSSGVRTYPLLETES